MTEKDRKFRLLFNNLIKGNSQNLDYATLKELFGAASSWAGKGKDELVQIICREIGIAAVAMFKEPLSQILEKRKLQITFEFVAKDASEEKSKKKKTTVTTKKSTK